jgi:DNA glycosylase AlkZ-like
MSPRAAALVRTRLRNQRLIDAVHRRPVDVVAWFGAMQAQEYEPAKWGIGLRMRDGAVHTDIERAIERGQILRTHALRPTWHFVTAADIRWILELTAPRVHRSLSSLRRRLELDTRTLVRCCNLFEHALADGKFLVRAELADRLARAKLPMTGIRLAIAVMYAELEGVICSGPRRAAKFTYANLAERAAKSRRLDREDALAELSRRYLQSHGPATCRDFAWWSGLTMADAKRGIEMVGARREDVDGLTYRSLESTTPGSARGAAAHLLPIYDEYLVAYRDRAVVPHSQSRITVVPGWNVNFQHAVVFNGQVAGTWRTPATSKPIVIQATLVSGLGVGARRAVVQAARRYGGFQEAPVQVSMT